MIILVDISLAGPITNKVLNGILKLNETCQGYNVQYYLEMAVIIIGRPQKTSMQSNNCNPAWNVILTVNETCTN